MSPLPAATWACNVVDTRGLVRTPMQVDHAYMSVATLTDDPLDKMDCIENAPSIRAIVIGKGEDFSNVAGMADGYAIMPQVRDEAARHRHCTQHAGCRPPAPLPWTLPQLGCAGVSMWFIDAITHCGGTKPTWCAWQLLRGGRRVQPKPTLCES